MSGSARACTTWSAYLERLRALLEQSAHNPFRNKDELGPGPAGKTFRRRRRWRCRMVRSGEMRCDHLVWKTRKRTHRIDPEKRSAYMKRLRAFRKAEKEAEEK